MERFRLLARCFGSGWLWPPGRMIVVVWLCIAGTSVEAAAQPRADRREAIISDVAVGHDGVLRGRIAAAGIDRRSAEVAGRHVVLLRGSRPAAVTMTGQRGEFVLENVPAGLYRFAVDGVSADGRFYRLWAPSTAPPMAEGFLRVAWPRPADGRTVRGQRPRLFPIMDLPQAAIIAGISAGAVAAPVIYHNTQLDNRAPGSP